MYVTVEIDGEHVVWTHWHNSVKDRGDLPELRFSAGQYEDETGAPEPNIDGEWPTEMVARLFEATPTGREDWPARWDCDLDAVRSTPAASRPAANDPELGAAGREPTDLLPPLGLTLTAGDTQAAPDLLPPVSRTTPTASGLVGVTRVATAGRRRTAARSPSYAARVLPAQDAPRSTTNSADPTSRPCAATTFSVPAPTSPAHPWGTSARERSPTRPPAPPSRSTRQSSRPAPAPTRPRVALLGEVEWGTTTGLPYLQRLTRARDVLTGRGLETTGCVLAWFSATGFTNRLRHEADAADDVRLIDLDRSYA
ncbi:hypothetical protein [Embleya sp. NPDC005971]|uniref:hypothetical protein n=1 Tax=Embleya sp. NPDC005971 TaxID=3156724 RepID=UPI0033F25238